MGLFDQTKRGDIVRMPAADLNAIRSAALAYRLDELSQRDPTARTERPTSTAKVRNRSGETIERFAAVALREPIITPSENIAEFQRVVTFEAWKAETDDLAETPTKIGILLEPLAPMAIGTAQLDGVCPCMVSISDDGHRFADLTEGETYLTSADVGTAEIMWIEGEENRAGSLGWALVRLLGGGGPTAPVILTVTLSSNQNDWSPVDDSDATIVWADADVVRVVISGASDKTVTGFAAGVDGDIKTIHVISTLERLVIPAEDSSSSAANRVKMGGTNRSYGVDASFQMRYDGTTDRWRILDSACDSKTSGIVLSNTGANQVLSNDPKSFGGNVRIGSASLTLAASSGALAVSNELRVGYDVADPHGGFIYTKVEAFDVQIIASSFTGPSSSAAPRFKVFIDSSNYFEVYGDTGACCAYVTGAFQAEVLVAVGTSGSFWARGSQGQTTTFAGGTFTGGILTGGAFTGGFSGTL